MLSTVPGKAGSVDVVLSDFYQDIAADLGFAGVGGLDEQERLFDQSVGGIIVGLDLGLLWRSSRYWPNFPLAY